jgi:ABC-type thiamine transport system substrate-binding protein
MVVVAEQHNTMPLEPQQAELVAVVLAFMQAPEYQELLILVAVAEPVVETELADRVVRADQEL